MRIYKFTGKNFPSDKTTIECWQKGGKDRDEIIENQGVVIRAERPGRFEVGTIIKDAHEIKEDQEYTFFCFKVAIGRPWVVKPAKMQSAQESFADEIPNQALLQGK